MCFSRHSITGAGTVISSLFEKVLHEGSLGRLVAFESRFDRWRPLPLTERMWKESPDAGGGTLLDLGPHLGDQALALFGKPVSVSADVLREKDGVSCVVTTPEFPA